MQDRIVHVPFGFERNKKVPVHLVGWGVLVDVARYRGQVLVPYGYDFKDKLDITGLHDYRDVAGTNRALIDYNGLSRLSYGIYATDGSEGKNPRQLQTLFFAQKMMRGFLSRLLLTEGSTLKKAEEEGLIYWQPWVDSMRKEILAYKNVFGPGEVPDFVREEVGNMWRRVMHRVDSQNKAALKRCIQKKTGRILELKETEGSHPD